MNAKKADIAFIAEYEDGSKEPFLIDPYTLNRGDHVARVIARELQQVDKLKPGK